MEEIQAIQSMTDKERLHRIWIMVEYLFTLWQYLPDEEKLLHLSRILEDARNGEQVEILYSKTGVIDVLHETLDLLRQIQQNPEDGIRGIGTRYLVHLRVDQIDELASKIEEILNDGLEEGRIGQP